MTRSCPAILASVAPHDAGVFKAGARSAGVTRATLCHDLPGRARAKTA